MHHEVLVLQLDGDVQPSQVEIGDRNAVDVIVLAQKTFHLNPEVKLNVVRQYCFNKIQLMVMSPGLAVVGGDSCFEACGF